MNNTSPFRPKIAGLVLAGGLSSRMHGHDKGLQMLSEQALVAHVIERLRPQVSQIWLCVNRHLAQYQAFGWPILSDDARYLGMGPLAGIASFSEYLPDEFTHVQIVPCDTPFLPSDLTEQLYAHLSTHAARAVFPRSAEGAHYSCALFDRNILPSAAESLTQGQRSLHQWLAHNHALALAGFDERAFANINTPQQLQFHTQHFGTNHA